MNNNIQNTIARYCFTVLLSALLLSGIVKAGQIEYNDYVDKANIVVGNSYSLADPSYLDEQANPSQFAASRENQVRLVYSRDDKTDVDGNKWWYEVRYTIYFTGQNLAPVNDTLRVAHGTGVNLYASAKVYTPGAHTIDIKVTSVAQSVGYVPDDIRLELATINTRYEELNISTTTVPSFDASSQTLTWGFVPGAESYDVEYVWVDAKGGTVATADAFERAVRVNVSNQHYQPNLTYRAGEVHFRVRAVGRFIDGVAGDFSHRRNGNWSATETWAIGTNDSWEDEQNLTYSTTFAEEGKFKKVMTYVDGAGKTRQSLTHLNSDSTTVVTQTEYDHEGRPVLTTIPIPIEGVDLGYNDLLNENTTATRYSKADFDFDHSLPPGAMDINTGASNYFSANNSFNTLHKNYIPNAEGFPFSQVEYMRDATGRVSRQGGVGKDHQLNSGHEVKFFYGNADATELHQMFGGNVGDASHYLKKMSVDPNGQVSFAWQDQEERVIATALAGDAPANVVALDNIAATQITADLQSRTDTGQNDVINFLDHTFLNESLNKNYYFNWDLGGAADVIGCNVCYACSYDLDITITDPEGELVTFNGQATMPDGAINTIATDHYHATFKGDNMDCPNYAFPGSINFTMNATKLGDYRIVKTLTVAEPDEAAILAALEANCASFPVYDDIYQDLYDIYALDCEPDTCEMEVLIYETAANSTVVGRDTIPCNGAYVLVEGDIVEGECAGILQAMIDDYAPNGWLHDAQVWATLTTPAAIEAYVLANHREACHYTACLEDAASKLWDIQMAAAPGYSFAANHNFIPTQNQSWDFWDPWFDIQNGPGGYLNTAFRDLLFDNTPGYLNSGFGLIDYFDPNTTTVPGILSIYATHCPSGPGTTQVECQNDLRWNLTRGAYAYEKSQMQIAHTIGTVAPGRGCTYFSDVHTIVVRPELPVQATSNIGNYNSALVASNCNINCAANVEIWMNQIRAACTTLQGQNEIDLEAALMDFCLGSCQDGNPEALLTDTYLNNGSLATALGFLSPACTTALTNLIIADPYVYNDGNGTTYEGPCNVWDGGFIAILDQYNTNWNQPINASIPLLGNDVLEHSYPTSTSLNITTSGLDLVGGSTCTAIQLLKESDGSLVPMTDVKMIRYPEYAASTIWTSPNSYAFLNTKVEVVLHIPVNGESTFPAHVFSGCFTNVVSAPSTCAYPQLPPDTIWTPTINPNALLDDCDSNAVAQATYMANLIYQQQVDLLLNEVLAEANALCRQKPPLYEDFRMTHTPKVYQYTLYFYDQAGSLIQTVPPEGVELLDDATTQRWVYGNANRTTDMPQHRMRTKYAFNSLGQMKTSETPDGGAKRIWYNSKDQVRLSQDARQILLSQYAYVKYDNLGRAVESGQIDNCANCTIDQALLDNPDFPERQFYGLSDITTTYYDTPYDPTFAADNLRTRVAAATREDDAGNYITTQVYDYDDHGNVQKTRTYLIGFGNFELDYEYDLISGKVNRANYQTGKADYFAHRYTYDADNRLTKAETTKDNVFWDRDARYFYYPHGPLARCEIGEDNVQGQDHYYSIHGWIKGVNMPSTLNPNGLADPGLDGEITTSNNDDKWVARDAFAYYLGFYEDDYNPIGSINTGTTSDVWSSLNGDILSLPPGANNAPGLYNGNIATMVTDLKKPYIQGSFIGGPIANAYHYDQLNRIKQMRSYHRGVLGWTRAGAKGIYGTDYSYDRNGNLETLNRRKPNTQLAGQFGSDGMDGLSYFYPTGPGGKPNNRLDHVEDSEFTVPGATDIGGQNSGNYTYDAIGNITADQSEKIANIDWDLQNKVRRVQRDAGNNPDNLPDLWFWYDATGNRIRKRVTMPAGVNSPNPWVDQYYVRDPQGNEMAVYEQYEENDTLYTYLKERPIYGSDRIGMDLDGRLLSKKCIANCGGGDEELPDPTGKQAPLVIGEIMYDSPKTGDDFAAGKEYQEGEYVVLINTSGVDLDLSSYQLRVGEDTLALSDSLAAGERVIVAKGENVPDFVRLVALPAEFESKVKVQNSFGLNDRGGILEVVHSSGKTVDALAYGDFYGLNAENAYLADSLIDSLSLRSSLNTVQRRSYGGGPISSGGGGALTNGAGVGETDPGIEPEPSDIAVGGKFYMNRGRKVYEMKNHLGNVLAVVSDVKIGIGPSNVQPNYVDYYKADIVEMTDYYPFGMQMVKRHYVADAGYRFGFQAQEGDDEWSGAGNMLAFRYRVHDARLGRFLSIDPLAPDYPHNSPYAFSENIVINASELEGLETHYEFYQDSHLDDPEYAEANLKIHSSGALAGALAVFTIDVVLTKGAIGTFLMTMEAGEAYNKVEKAEREYWKGNSEEAARLQQEAGEQVTWLGGFWAGPKIIGRVVRYIGSFEGIAAAEMETVTIADWRTKRFKFANRAPQPQGTSLKTFVNDGKVGWNPNSISTGPLKETGRFDFVITVEGELRLGRGHFALSNEAEEVLAAGRIRIKNGEVQWFSNESGHLRASPSEAETYFAPAFSKAGVDLHGATGRFYKFNPTGMGRTLETQIEYSIGK